MFVLVDFEGAWPAFFDGVAKTVQRAHAGVSAPGKDQLRGAAHPDHLIVNDVGRHSDEREIAPSLADDFVTGSAGRQMGKAFERDLIAVVNKFGYCFF
jgi:hypothetical protein